MPTSPSTRRWQRHPVDLPVRVAVANGFSTTVVSGRGTELSEGGMELYAGISLNPGDLLEVEFGIPCRMRMMAVVRYRSGYCFGLEFIAPLQTEPES
jgi:PilZ domain